MVNNVISISFSTPPTANARRGLRRPPQPLDPFLIGPENLLIRVALDTVFQPTARYGPITLYGPSGVGKSHLLEGVAREHAARFPAAPILATTGSDFARSFASAIDSDSVSEFRHRHRSASLLVIDDLQELGPKPAAQVELLQTLDALLRGKRHVFTATPYPLHDETVLIPGLRSRLSAGLSVPLAFPSPVTRRAMLERLAARHSLVIPEPAANLLIEAGSGPRPSLRTFPQLRHAVLQLASGHLQPARRITREAVAQLLAQQQTDSRLPIREITQHVARLFHLKPSELAGSARRQTVVQARAMAILLARKLTGATYQRIGCCFGRRDHTTILHACRHAERLLRTNPDLMRTMNDLEALLSRRTLPREAQQ